MPDISSRSFPHNKITFLLSSPNISAAKKVRDPPVQLLRLKRDKSSRTFTIELNQIWPSNVVIHAGSNLEKEDWLERQPQDVTLGPVIV